MFETKIILPEFKIIWVVKPDIRTQIFVKDGLEFPSRYIQNFSVVRD